MQIARNLGMLLAVVWLVTAFSPPAPAATVEELLAKINKLPAAERQKRLEEGAKKEEKLRVFSNQRISTIRAYVKGFRKKYPFVKVQSSRLQGARGLDRILLEHRVGKLEADIVGVDFDNIGELLKAGILHAL